MSAPVHEPAVVGITIAGNAYDPDPATAAVGDTITWTHADSIPHDVRGAGGPPGLESPMLEGGQAWSYLATEPGTFTYLCTIHESMVSTLTVVEHDEEEVATTVVAGAAPAPEPAPEPAPDPVVEVAPVSAAAPVVAPVVAVPPAVVDEGARFHLELGFLGAVLLSFAIVAVLLGVLPGRSRAADG